MDALKETRGLYKPIRVLFSTPVYERALETCWHLQSYKTNIAMVLEFLRLQQEHLLSPEVTDEEMTSLLLEQGKKSLRVQLWEFEIEDRDEDVAKPLLNLTWDVINSLKMRDVVFEARRFLTSPNNIPPSFQHPKLVSLAHTYARTLSQLNQDTPRLLQPREVVMEVVPRVIHGLWLPPPSASCLSMPSKELSTPAIGLTQSVLDRVSKTLSSMLQQVHFTRSVRDEVVQRIVDTITQRFPGDRLEMRLSSFSLDLLRSITSAAAEEICELFQPQSEPDEDPETSAVLESAPPLPPTKELTEETDAEELAEEPAEDVSIVLPTETVLPEKLTIVLPADTVLPEELTTVLPEELTTVLPADTVLPQELTIVQSDTECPDSATETQMTTELPAAASRSTTDVGVQTSSLPSPSSTEGCIFCRFSRWIRNIYNYFLSV